MTTVKVCDRHSGRFEEHLILTAVAEMKRVL